ncbi:MAG: hypothetical protein HC785_24240 [Calothrix sp. CSU_2_0]|nr:hypothetical protein [Calothrix sp. CSU_2_0]
MLHHTKNKGDIATTKAIADLTQKGYLVLTPLVCEHSPFDFVAYKDGKFYKIQAKYSSDNRIVNRTIWVDKKGIHKKYYKKEDFDFYAVYLPDIDKVVYPSVNFTGYSIATKLPNSPTPFYWWEDFTDFTDNAPKRSYKEFGVDLTTRKVNSEARIKTRKVERPLKEELEKMVWEKPTLQIGKDFGVSDKAVEKWCKAYGIEKPPRGYWMKKGVGKESKI